MYNTKLAIEIDYLICNNLTDLAYKVKKKMIDNLTLLKTLKREAVNVRAYVISTWSV